MLLDKETTKRAMQTKTLLMPILKTDRNFTKKHLEKALTKQLFYFPKAVLFLGNPLGGDIWWKQLEEVQLFI